MKKPLRGCLYVCIALIVYGAIVFSFITPYGMWQLIVGPKESHFGIKVCLIDSQYEKKGYIKVLLPDRYQEGKQYPVLYILPSTPRFLNKYWNNGILEVAKENVHNKYQVICVTPMFKDMPWYADNPHNPKIMQESFFVKEVVPYVEEHYSSIPRLEGRLLLGYSKSGWGAYSLLLRYPDLFGKAAAWDAPMLFQDLNVRGSALKKIFGSDENFMTYHIPSLLKIQSERLREDKARLVLMGYGYNPDHVEETHTLLMGLGIPHFYKNYIKRKHCWGSGWIPEAVSYLFK